MDTGISVHNRWILVVLSFEIYWEMNSSSMVIRRKSQSCRREKILSPRRVASLAISLSRTSRPLWSRADPVCKALNLIANVFASPSASALSCRPSASGNGSKIRISFDLARELTDIIIAIHAHPTDLIVGMKQ